LTTTHPYGIIERDIPRVSISFVGIYPPPPYVPPYSTLPGTLPIGVLFSIWYIAYPKDRGYPKGGVDINSSGP